MKNYPLNPAIKGTSHNHTQSRNYIYSTISLYANLQMTCYSHCTFWFVTLDFTDIERNSLDRGLHSLNGPEVVTVLLWPALFSHRFQACSEPKIKSYSNQSNPPFQLALTYFGDYDHNCAQQIEEIEHTFRYGAHYQLEDIIKEENMQQKFCLCRFLEITFYYSTVSVQHSINSLDH